MFDKLLMFSDRQDFGDTTPLAHRASSTIHDMLEGQDTDVSSIVDPGQGYALHLVVQCDETFVVDTGSPELQIELVMSPASNLLGGTAEVVLARIGGLKANGGFTDPEFDENVLVYGRRWSAQVAPLNPIAQAVSPAYANSTPSGNRHVQARPQWPQRYLGVIYTCPTGATDDWSAGKLSAWLQYERASDGPDGAPTIYPTAMKVV